MRFCVGDGNHSLATAKAVWEEAKQTLSPEEQENHPLRYALCELVNLHDPAMPLLPIHRVISGVSSSMCIQYIVDHLNSVGADARLVFSEENLHYRLQKLRKLFSLPAKAAPAALRSMPPLPECWWSNDSRCWKILCC